MSDFTFTSGQEANNKNFFFYLENVYFLKSLAFKISKFISLQKYLVASFF